MKNNTFNLKSIFFLYLLLLVSFPTNASTTRMNSKEESVASTTGEVTHPTSSRCQDGSIDLTIAGGVGPYHLTWTDRFENIISTHDELDGNTGEEDLSGLGPGVYTAIIEDAICGKLEAQFGLFSGLNRITLLDKQNAKICDSDGSSDGEGCTGSLSVSASFNGEFQIRWTGPDGYTSQGSFEINNLCAGDYTISLFGKGGCALEQTFTICCCESGVILEKKQKEGCSSSTIFPVAIRQDIYESPSTATSEDGRLKVRLEGGSPERAFQWTGPNGFTSTGTFIQGLGIGIYTARVTDGCSEDIREWELVDCSQADININPEITPTCEGVEFGSIELFVTGTNPPFRFRWEDTDSREATRNFLGAGSYCVTVSDNKGCSIRKICYDVGVHDFTRTPVTTPCGTDVTCNEFPITFIPFSGGLDCRFDDSESCATENCYCPLTGEVSIRRPDQYRQIFNDFEACEVVGLCPNGEWERISAGRPESNSFITSVCNQFNCGIPVCVTQEACILNGDVRITGETVNQINISPDCGCRGAGSGCAATCDGIYQCVPSNVAQCTPDCLTSSADDNHSLRPGSHTEMLEPNVADILLRMYLRSNFEGINRIFLPNNILPDSKYSDWTVQRKILDLDESYLYTIDVDYLKEVSIFSYTISKDHLYINEKEIHRNKNIEENIVLSPNPVTDRINLKWESGKNKEKLLVSLLDVNGRVLRVINWPNTENEMTIDASNLKAGAYRIRITHEGTAASILTFIKTK